LRLISKFRDYYDGAVGGVPDPLLTYVRKTVEHSISLSSFDLRGYGERKSEPLAEVISGAYKLLESAPGVHSGHRVKPTVIGFCGKAYVVYLAATGGATHPWEAYLNPEEVLNAALSQVADRSIEDPIMLKSGIENSLAKDGVNNRWWGSDSDYGFNDAGWAAWTEATNFDLGDDVFRELDAPVFSIGVWGGELLLETNPVLKHLGFARLVDPWTAYQELSMYLGSNMVVQVDPNANITDADRAQATHG